MKGSSQEDILLIDIGMHNSNSGPDFFNAKIKINNQLWAGNVELHIKSSDWYIHNHETDLAYDSVILHVVWEHDMPVYRVDNTEVATLVLKDYVQIKALVNYEQLFSSKKRWINCENQINQVDSFIFNNWIERLYFERLQQKSNEILTLLKDSNNDWEAVLFKLLARNFGLKVNKNAFFNMANSFDFSLIRKSQNTIVSMEALLFGQAGLLKDTLQDAYYTELQKEYQFLQVKYKIQPIDSLEVKFFRLRPSNFPTIRLSQLAQLYVTENQLFSKIIALENSDEFYKLFQVTTSYFWDTHYSFTSTSAKRKKIITKNFIDLLMINTIIPLKFVYQNYIGQLNESQFLKLIQQIIPEKNTIIDKFKSLKIETTNAFETQALLQLKNEYCNQQKCLKCAIGSDVLKS